MRLYELTEQYQRIVDLSNSDSGDEDSLTQLLESITEQIHDKIIKLGAVIKNLDAKSNALHHEISLMVLREGRINKKIEHLKEYINQQMISVDIDRVEGVAYDVFLRNNPEKVNITFEKDIPEEYMISETISRPDKLKIKNALQNHKNVPGCELIKCKNVVIK